MQPTENTLENAVVTLIAAGHTADQIATAAKALEAQAARQAVLSQMIPLPDGFAGTAAAMRDHLPRMMALPPIPPKDAAEAVVAAIIANDDAALWPASYLAIASLVMAIGLKLPVQEQGNG